MSFRIASLSLVAFNVFGLTAKAQYNSDFQAGSGGAPIAPPAVADQAQATGAQLPPATPTPAMNQNANSVVASNVAPPAVPPQDNRWRFKLYNGEWWYWMPANYWMFYRGNQWNRYDQATFQPLQAIVQTAPVYGTDGYGYSGYWGPGYSTYYYGRPGYGYGYNNYGYDNGYAPYGYGYGYGGYGNPYFGGNAGVRSGANIGGAIGGAFGGRSGANVGGGIGAAIGGSRR